MLYDYFIKQQQKKFNLKQMIIKYIKNQIIHTKIIILHKKKQITFSFMAISKSQLKYHLTHFRTRKAYLIFQITQLILSIVIIITAFISPNLFRQPLVLWMQFILLSLMTIDLFVIRCISQGSLCQKKTNKIDSFIYGIFLFTFGFMCFTEGKTKQRQQIQNQQIIEADDIIIIVIIVCRYLIQIYQIVNQIQDSQNNIECQTNIINFDLNKSFFYSINDQTTNDVLQDEIIRERIKAKNSNSPHQKKLISSIDLK